MRHIFINSKETRLKAGWRIFFFLIIFFSCSSLIFVLKPLFGEITKREYVENYSLVIVTVLAISAIISVILSRKLLDKRSFTSLGLNINKQSAKDVLFGFIISAIMAGLFFFILKIFGLIEFNGFNFKGTNEIIEQPFNFIKYMSIATIGSLGLLLFEHILVGFWEELVFRGYLFQNMIDGMGIKLAIIISCLIYGLIHTTNPNASILSSTIIVLFGFLRIYGYLSTKMLWLSMGMHIGWNFFQGPIFSFAASGHKKATLLNHTFISKYKFLTGGEFGPEGSILILPILFLALLLMRWYAKKYYSNVSYFTS